MDRSDIVKLIYEAITQDEYGIEHATETERDVYVQVESVTRAEFFDAGRAGLNPEYRFTMFAGDYLGERIVEYQGMRYAVYRTYRGKNDTLELYVERKGGTNGSN